MCAGVCGCKEWLGALHEAEQKACLDSKLHACGFVPHAAIRYKHTPSQRRPDYSIGTLTKAQARLPGSARAESGEPHNKDQKPESPLTPITKN